MRSFSIIVAVDQKLGIGKNNDLAWTLSGDMKHFKDITTQTSRPKNKNAVIMGENTWFSLPEKFRPLPKRANIIVSFQEQSAFPDTTFAAKGIDAALKLINENPALNCIENIFIIGGASIYRQAIEMKECTKLYITHVMNNFDCDAYFPDFYENFQQTSKAGIQTEDNIQYYFAEYKRL